MPCKMSSEGLILASRNNNYQPDAWPGSVKKRDFPNHSIPQLFTVVFVANDYKNTL